MIKDVVGIIIIAAIVGFIEVIVLLIILIKMCPDVMFAVNRVIRVMGRIAHLIISIIIMNGISMLGVPLGVI